MTYDNWKLATPPTDEDDGYPPPCIDRNGHSWVVADEDNGGDGRCYCEYCGADGDA